MLIDGSAGARASASADRSANQPVAVRPWQRFPELLANRRLLNHSIRSCRNQLRPNPFRKIVHAKVKSYCIENVFMAPPKLDAAYLSTLPPDISREILELSKNYDFKVRSSISPNKDLLSRYGVRTREEFARATGTMVLYLRHEVPHVREAEEAAAMKALPEGYSVDQLNVINIGAGGRRIRPQFICLDAFRSSHDDEPSGRHHVAMGDSVLSTLHAPPFRDESIDAVLSLHSLEHDCEPIPTLLNWIKMLKPGGGLGLILPDFRYTRTARRDRSDYGHKWDPYPQLIEQWHRKYLSDHVTLEALNSYEYKISFDCIFRKPGEFKSFKQLTSAEPISGRQLAESGRFPNDIY